MQKDKVKEIIEKLLLEIEEEEIGISLYSALYLKLGDLKFFKDGDRERVTQILKIISDDSERHETILKKIIIGIGGKNNAR